MNILIAGANGGVAQAIGKELASRGNQLSTISRSDKPEWSGTHLIVNTTSNQSVKRIKNWLTLTGLKPDLIIQCAGVLHQDNQMPEKALSRLSTDWLSSSIETNVSTHIHLAQAVDHLITKNSGIHWVSLSALVGSISENKLGGWHSYRMSKAALNMFVKNLGIEWERRSSNTVVAALHPGTTDTALSEPFQRNIATDKLYSPALTGKRLADVVENLQKNQHGKLLHWDGTAVSF